jgi:hypothetical protein
MNDYFFNVRGSEKLNELRREGMSSQEFRRLGRPARPLLPRSARLVALMVVLLGVALVLAH